MRAVDPDRRFDQAPEFRILRGVFELNIEPIVSGFPHAFARQEQIVFLRWNSVGRSAICRRCLDPLFRRRFLYLFLTLVRLGLFHH
ncbi:MAG: hypothetical protein A3G40_06050 [Deltaproteobacteria bacterium RIFCSPLOWO2_12_FULL_57_22]|nr:MAG: hypothetical protein A3G40_06050 [Deltaproteobacteria bacterium RIFCSPLOWO2_12_FULL_57_22]